MLGNDLTIRRFTATAERLFNLIPSDIGRRLSDLSRVALVPDLEASVRQVIENLTPIEREAQDRDGHWFLLRIRPYRTRENKIDGAVLMLLDHDELRRAVDVVVGTITQPALVLGADLKVRRVNEAFCQAFQVGREEMENKSFPEAAQGQWNIPELRALLEQVLPKDKQVNNFEIEANFPNSGLRKLRLNARGFFRDGLGMQLILLAIEDIARPEL